MDGLFKQLSPDIAVMNLNSTEIWNADFIQLRNVRDFSMGQSDAFKIDISCE